MLKNVIAPIQAWLLSQGRCVACGRPLHKMPSKAKKDGVRQVTCECSRVYIHDTKTDKFRRAVLSEIV